jgi:hypothetical protein
MAASLFSAGGRLMEFAGPERAQKLLAAPNAKAIHRRNDGALVGLELQNFGEQFRTPPKGGNPQKLSHNAETDTNVRGVWTFKRLPQLESNGHSTHRSAWIKSPWHCGSVQSGWSRW